MVAMGTSFHLPAGIPIISNLALQQTSTTAVLSCSYTGHQTSLIIGRIPSGVTTSADGNKLTTTSLGPEATGVYQWYVNNDIGCDHREISILVPVDPVAPSSFSIASTYSSIINTSSADFSSSVLLYQL